jgi:sporulation protein YabP
MTYEEKNRRPELAHHVIADGRERLSISGVEDVESFDEESVVAITSAGVLVVRGSQLHIDKLSPGYG